MVVNLDKKEFLHPHKFGDSLAMLGFGCSRYGTLTGLTILLACSHHRGGGDLAVDKNEWMGRWAGDRLVILGDYSEPGDIPGMTETAFRALMDGVWEEEPLYADISNHVVATLYQKDYLKKKLTAKRKQYGNPD